MRGEKPGGHGERCVAVGTLDMALWDASEMPLYQLPTDRTAGHTVTNLTVPAYAGGGY